MKDDFLTIPNAPDYEINSELICRDKKTGHILKPIYPKKLHIFLYTVCFSDGRRLQCSAPKLRRLAEAAADVRNICNWQPVPSLNNLYECDKNGRLRNAKTKRLIKPNKWFCYDVGLGEKRAHKKVSRSSLLWEVFGVPLHKRYTGEKPVIVSKGNQRFWFGSKAEAAEFLSKKILFVASTVRAWLAQCRHDIEGWHINYICEDTSPPASTYDKWKIVGKREQPILATKKHRKLN